MTQCIKLVAVDMDGTLLKTDGTISPLTRDCVARLREKGVVFVLSTGRPLSGVQAFCKDLHIEDQPLVLFNGAKAYVDGKLIYRRDLDEETVSRILQDEALMPYDLAVWADGELYITRPGPLAEFYMSIVKEKAHYFDRTNATLHNVTKVVALWDQSMGEMAKRVAPHYPGVNVHTTRPYFLEFNAHGADKGSALLATGTLLNILPREMLAFGDGYNDITMLASCIGVAMANAEAPVQKAARYVTQSNDEDGIPHALFALGVLEE